MPIFRPSSWPLSVRIGIDLLIVALVPLILAMWLVSRRGVEAIEQEARVGRQLLATVTATRLDQLLEDTLRMVADVSGDERVVDFCGNAPERTVVAPLVQARLQAAVDENPDVASAFIIDTSGIGLASTNPKNVGQDLSFRQYWREARDGSPHLSDLVVGKTSSKPGIYCSQPVWRDGAVVGVVVMKLQGERVGDIVQSARPSEDGLAVLVDRDGIILAHPDPKALYRSLGQLSPERLREIDPKVRYELDTIESIDQPELAETLTAAREAGSTLFRRRADDAELVLGFAPMQKKEWLVGVAQPMAALLAPVHTPQATAGPAGGDRRDARGGLRSRAGEADRATDPRADRCGGARGGGGLRDPSRLAQPRRAGHLGRPLRRHAPAPARRARPAPLAGGLRWRCSSRCSRSGRPTPVGLEIVAHSRYCDATGGDYYDFIDIAEIMPAARWWRWPT